MIKSIVSSAAATTLLLAMASAHAGSLAVNGWLFSGHNVNVGTPQYAGAAGGFKGTLTGMTDPRFNLAPVEMYCVDLGQYISLSGRYSVNIEGEAGTSDFTIVSALSQFGATKARRMGELVSFAKAASTRVDTSAESTAMQLALWNTVYDTDNTLAGGTFKDNVNSSYASDANTLLAGSAGFAVDKDLYVLRSSTRQDQLFWIDLPSPIPQISVSVPEPGSLALAGLALAGLTASRRRRKVDQRRRAPTTQIMAAVMLRNRAPL